MKKTYLLLIIFLIGCNALFAQQTDVVQLKFSVHNKQINSEMDNEVPLLNILTNDQFHLSNVGTKTDSNTYIYERNTPDYYTVLLHSDKKYIDLQQDNLLLQFFKTELIPDTSKVIQGYTCNMANVTLTSDDEKYNFEVWYTAEIPNYIFYNMLYLKQVPGAALQIITDEFTIDAYEIKRLKLRETPFKIPDDYTIVDVDNISDLDLNDSTSHDTTYFKMGMDRYFFENENAELFGIKNGKGDIIVDAKYAGLLFYDGEYSIVNNIEGKYGAIDYDGNEVIPLRYDFLDYDSKQKQFLFAIGDKFGLMSKDKIIIPAQFELLSYMTNGYAIFTEDSKHGLIDSTNNIVVPALYSTIIEHTSELFLHLRADGIFDLHRIKDQEIIAKDYDFISIHEDSELILVQKDNKYGYLDQHGKIVIPIKYAYATLFSDGRAQVYEDEDFKIGYYINTNGKRIGDLH